MKKLFALLFLVHASPPITEADEGVVDFSLEELQFTFFTPPIRLEDLSGATIAELSKRKGFLPVLYPRRESLFHWLDTGDPDLLTLDQLIAEPDLFKKPEPFSKKNLYILEKVQVDNGKDSKEVSVGNVREQSISSVAHSKTSAPLVNPVPSTIPRSNDQEFKPFSDKDGEVFLFQREAKSLTHLTELSKQRGDTLPVPPRFPIKQVNSERFQKEAQIFSDPELLEEYERRISSSTLGRMSSAKRTKSWNGSSISDRSAPANLKLKASKRTSDGKVLPAQASDFYLTTRDLRELLKDLDAQQALAGEVKSVAEIWANAEKNLSSNPEIALGVKSILLQAKVGRTRTNAAGHASLHDLPSDEKYFLIGIDKDENTNVVTIWSKEVEVNPGDNEVELSSSDVIYQD